MRTFAILLRRDLAILLPGGARGSAFLPLIFFLLVAVLYPFAVGPEPSLLARTGGGVLWVAALLASILPLDRHIYRRVMRARHLGIMRTGCAGPSLCAFQSIAVPSRQISRSLVGRRQKFQQDRLGVG